MASMIIANRLSDGLVVFYVRAGEWARDIAAGALIDDRARAEALLRAAKHDEEECLVIDPNVIEVEIVGGRRKPTAIREAIRAFGPSPIARTDQLSPH
jgi:Protein of unknown function (DUF2849)